MKTITSDLLKGTVENLLANKPETNFLFMEELSTCIPDIDDLIIIDADLENLEYISFHIILAVTCNVLNATGVQLRPVSPAIWKQCLESNSYMFALAISEKKRETKLLDKFAERYFQSDYLDFVFTILKPEEITEENFIIYYRRIIIAKSVFDVMYLSAHNNKPEHGITVFPTDIEPSLSEQHCLHDLMGVLFPDPEDFDEDFVEGFDEDIDFDFAQMPSHGMPSPGMPFFPEYSTWKLHKQMDEQGPMESKADIDAFMQSVTDAGGHPEFTPVTNEDRSADLTYQAFETENAEDIEKLASQALSLDPDNADAYVHLAAISSTNEEILVNLRKGMAAGERKVAHLLEDNSGQFWGILETRPYMRAMYDYGQTLLQLDQSNEAIEIFERMLVLNESDNLGVRFPLLLIYIDIQDYTNAKKLIKRFPSDCTADFTWNSVLVYILAGDSKHARAALKHARKCNPYVYDFLTGKRIILVDFPEVSPIGSSEEAIDYCLICKYLWTNQALKWLKKH